MFNEFHLIQFMGLAEATDEELQQILYPELYEMVNKKYLDMENPSFLTHYQLKHQAKADAQKVLENNTSHPRMSLKKSMIKKFSPLMIVNNSIDGGAVSGGNNQNLIAGGPPSIK